MNAWLTNTRLKWILSISLVINIFLIGAAVGAGEDGARVEIRGQRCLRNPDTAVHMMVIAKAMINACQKLFVVSRRWNAVPQQVWRVTRARIRQRQRVLDDRECRRTEIRKWNLIVDVRLAGERILQQLRQGREVALSLRGSRNERRRVGSSLGLARRAFSPPGKQQENTENQCDTNHSWPQVRSGARQVGEHGVSPCAGIVVLY